ncbi:MAG: HD domain-containing protein [Candidatus Micrarchaeaceae archaeon]
MESIDVKKITEDLIKLQRAYSFTPRAMVTEERYRNLVESGILKDYTYDSLAIREPLIEHVGNLPIIASYLHPYIEHKNEVDLGRALIMLSVHDIGETKVGDILTYAKQESHVESEFKVARELLPDYLYAYFEEIEKRETMDAKFAKSVDSIAPLLHEMPLPKVTLDRFKHHNFGIENIIAKKKAHFEWDTVLKSMFEYIIEKYTQMEG